VSTSLRYRLEDFFEVLKPRLQAKIRHVLVSEHDLRLPEKVIVYIANDMSIDQLTVRLSLGFTESIRSRARLPSYYSGKMVCHSLANIKCVKLDVENKNSKGDIGSIRKWLERDSRDE
jgi:hypothetical protein